MVKEKNIFIAFIRYNIVAILATSLDFSVFIILKNVFHLWYVGSTFISAITGGILAFILNKIWVFESKNSKTNIQAFKFISVWAGSILLNTLGLYLIVESSRLNATVSKILVAIIVSFGYNFTMNRFFIFKENE